MSSKLAFYRKYRPNCFKEIVGQDFIIKTLENSILKNKHSHAYIFSGPRGVGKTSIAKIFSKALNCLNNKSGDCCNECENCKLINNNQTTDYVELDAASNNGVNEVRSIIDTIGYVPSSLKTKVYIIDEAHMLSNAAWNAFLKSIEEPPKYLVFIFATTEPHKFPATIISRCQRYNFMKFNNKELKKHIEFIAKKEKIKIDSDALDKLTLLSDGSLRDACSLLDQLDSYTNSHITNKDINDVFGLIDVSEKIELIKNIATSNFEWILKKLNDYEDMGANFYQMAIDIIEMLYDKLVYEKTGKLSLLKILSEVNINFLNIQPKVIIKMLDIWQNNLYRIKSTTNQKFFFEISCFESCKIFEFDNDKNLVNSKIYLSSKESEEINNKLLNKLEPKEEKQNNVIETTNVNKQHELDKNQTNIFKSNNLNEIEREIKDGFENIQEIDIKSSSKEEKLSGDQIVDKYINESINVEPILLIDLQRKFNVKPLATEETHHDNTKNSKPTKQINETVKTILENKESTKIEKIKKEEKNDFEMNLFDVSAVDSLENFVINKLEKNNIDKKKSVILNLEKQDKDKNNFKEIFLQIAIHNEEQTRKFINDFINELKKKVPTNKIEANLMDIEKVVVASKNGIALLGSNEINIKTINNISESEEFLTYIKDKFNKFYKVIAISKKEIDLYAKEIVTKKLNKKNTNDVDISNLSKKLKTSSSAKDLAEQMLDDLIED